MLHWAQRVRIYTCVAAVAVITLILCVLISSPANAAINPQINFQGKITNPDGTNVTNGNYSIVYSMYVLPVGGTAIWQETQAAVAVNDGVFQVALGSVSALPGSVDFNTSQIYLGIKVGADPEMTPRIRFTAAPYAFNSEKLNGLSSSDFGQLSSANLFTGNNTITGSSASQFVIQNLSTEKLFVADTAAQKVAIGPAAVAANGALTVGTNTIVAGGGMYFGTDTNLYRVNTNRLKTDGNLDIGSTLTVGGSISLGTNVNMVSFSDNLYINAGAAADIYYQTGGVQYILGSSLTALKVTGNSVTPLNIDTTNNRTNIGGSGGTATLNVTGTTYMAGAVTVQGSDVSQFKIQNGSSQSLLVADTTNQRLAVGPAAAAANGVLTVGTNTAVASGGVYFGTDTNLYRSASSELTSSGALKVTGILSVGSGTGVSTIQSWGGNTAAWIDLPTTGPSGIGSGGPGASAWIGYASSAGNWFTDAAAGDIAYRNGSGRLLFGVTGGLSNMAITNTNIQIGQSATDAAVVFLTLDSYNTAADPTGGVNGSQYYNSNLARFRCYEGGIWKNCITKELATRSFVDSVSDAVLDNNTTSYWDTGAENNNTTPNITLSSSTKSVWVVATMETQSTGTNDVEVTARLERSTGASPSACNSGTAVGGQPGTFASNNLARKTSTTQAMDTPGVTTKVWYTLCADSDTVGTTANITRIRITLLEVDNANN